MNDFYPSTDNWEYGTGRTKPPKSRGGLIALLLILVIFLTGVATVLGILNIRLAFQLRTASQEESAISFIQEEQTPPQASQDPGFQEEPRTQITMELEEGAPGQENVAQEGGLPLQDIYRRCIDSVVSISCAWSGGMSSGTGVVLDEGGYIVTNAHVVEGAASVTVTLTDGRSFPADLVGADKVSDLAVLFIDATGLKAAAFGNSDAVQVGDSVVAIGDPLGAELRGTMTDGIISAINRDVVLEGRTMSLLQTNAALNSGNSGGPLINCYGQVIGINTLKIGDFMSRSGVEGLGFAIPSCTVKDIVDQLIAQGYVSGRPTLGLEGEPLGGFYQRYYGLPAGLYLTQVEENSPAALAGIQPGDILVAIDGVPVSDINSLNRELYAREVGDLVTVVIYRSGVQAEARLRIAEAK